jgi:hypothetical protein
LVCGMRVSKRVGKRSDSAALESGLLLFRENKDDGPGEHGKMMDAVNGRVKRKRRRKM